MQCYTNIPVAEVTRLINQHGEGAPDADLFLGLICIQGAVTDTVSAPAGQIEIKS